MCCVLLVKESHAVKQRKNNERIELGVFTCWSLA